MSLESIVAQFDPLLASLIGGKPGHRAAVWGQALQESNFNPGAIEKPGTNQGGIGLWQHTGPRRRNLEAFAASRGKPWQDIETQVRFVASELNGPENHAWIQTQKTTSIEAANETFELDFERAAPATAGMARRLEGAKRALAVILKQQGTQKMPDTVPPAPTQTEQQLDTIFKQGEALGNQALISRFPAAAPIVQLIEDSVINPFLPTIEHAFGAQINANAAAHAVTNIVFSLLISGLGLLAGKVVQPKA